MTLMEEGTLQKGDGHNFHRDGGMDFFTSPDP